MNKKQFKANEKYLSDIGVVISDEPTWKNEPYSRDLFLSSNAGGDLCICVEELTRERVLERLSDFDVNEETILWWGTDGSRVPFETIKDLYEDIEQWRDDFIEIAENMPF